MNKTNENRHCSYTMAAEELAVFVETNIGTRIVMTVSLDFTVGLGILSEIQDLIRDLSRFIPKFRVSGMHKSGSGNKNYGSAGTDPDPGKLEKTHGNCFSSSGEIRVYSLMIKQKHRFLYLADTVPLKYIFCDKQKPWFIHAEARVISGSQEPSISNSIDISQIRHSSASDTSIEGVSTLIQCENKKIKKSRAKPDSRNFASEQMCLDKREFLGTSTSEPQTIGSSFAIQRAAEMQDSECFKSFIPKTPERKPVDLVSVSEMISKKLRVAANNIRMQGKTHNSSSLLSSIFRSKTCRYKSLDRKTITSAAKFLVFEIPNTED